MHGMLLAESAVLLCFHTVRMSFLVLSHVVVALFAFCTCQCNFCAHDFHLHLYYRSSHLPLRYLFLSIKKRPKLFHSPVYYTIEISIRQGILRIYGMASLSMADKYGDKIYVLRTGFSEDPGARLYGTACCVDIIHQYNFLHGGRQGSRREGLLQIL